MDNHCKEHGHEWDMENKSCTFGCNAVVDADTGMCPNCRDHSNNVVECEYCGVVGTVDGHTGIVTPDEDEWYDGN